MNRVIIIVEAELLSAHVCHMLQSFCCFFPQRLLSTHPQLGVKTAIFLGGGKNNQKWHKKETEKKNCGEKKFEKNKLIFFLQKQKSLKIAQAAQKSYLQGRVGGVHGQPDGQIDRHRSVRPLVTPCSGMVRQQKTPSEVLWHLSPPMASHATQSISIKPH